MKLLLLCVVSLCVIGGLCLNNGLGLTPPMGYNTWYDLGCSSQMNETTIKHTADIFVSSGLSKLGYKYINMDDCWAEGRDANGRVYPDPTRFPSGIKALADYIHSKFLLFGLYTDRGNYTCGGRPGSKGYEKIDAETYASWGIDFVKEDSCFATQVHDEAFKEYGLMRDSLNATGRRIYFNLCGWNDWYAPVGYSLGNSWRIAQDDTNWQGVLVNVDTDAALSQYAGPVGWNDPCLLLGEDYTGMYRITNIQQKAQFSLWAVLAAPMLISANIRNMTPTVLSIYSNVEVININQDKAGIQGVRLVGGPLSTGQSTTNVWGRQLAGGDWALLFLNNGKQSIDITCDETCFGKTSLPRSGTLKVRDVWLHMDLNNLTGRIYTAKHVSPNGGVVMLRLSPV